MAHSTTANAADVPNNSDAAFSSLRRIGLISRILILILAITTQLTRLQWTHSHPATVTLSHYDVSTQLRLDEGIRESCSSIGPKERIFIDAMGWIVNWDGLHFLDTTDGHQYPVEKESAFLPGLPFLVRASAESFQSILSLLFLPIPCVYTLFLISIFVVSNLVFFCCIELLYEFTFKIFRHSYFAYVTTLCFIFSPAGIFMHAFYTESIFLALALGGMLARESGRPWASAFLFALATTIRSNGYVFAGFFIYDAIRATLLARRWLEGAVVKSWLQAIMCSTIVVSPFLVYQVWLYRRFCSSDTLPSMPSYCESLLPNVYAHVQSKYWNVGLFRYYTLQQLPNFLFALPIWLLSFYGILTYARTDWMRFLTLGIRSSSSQSSSSKSAVYFSHRCLVYIYLWLVLFGICLTVLHVQVSTRFLSACPPVYWYAAHLMQGPSKSSGDSSSILDTRRLLTMWSTGFIIVGSVLFSAFLPWT